MANLPPRLDTGHNMYHEQPYVEDPYASPRAPPPPPQHRQPFRPGFHPDSNFERIQEDRYGVSPQQSDYRDARDGSRSPELQRRPVGATSHSPVDRQVSPIDRHLSPSPPLHPGMPALPPPVSARSPYHDGSHPSSSSPPYNNNHNNNNYYGPTAAGAAVGAGAGIGAAAMMHDQSPPQGHQYGHMAGYSEPSEQGSDAPLSAAAIPPGMATPGSHSDGGYPYHDYSPSPVRLGNPYSDSQVPTPRSHEQMLNMAYVDPNAILDDGEDFPMYPKRASRVNLPFNKSRGSVNSMPVIGAGAIGDDMSGGSARDLNGNYGPIPANRSGVAEKNPWMQNQKKNGKRWKKILFIVVGFLIVAGIAAGAAGGVLANKSTSKSNAAAADDASGDLSKDSAEIKKLMNNPNLHKVFSGFGYTPFATQYPECLTNPPSQNNVTRDVAMLSQLTNVVRLYGTDCNQTEMVLHAIDRLGLTDFKVWLGVWLGRNATTNTRQVDQMWKILDSPTYGPKYVKGVVVGNEVLFREDLTATQLGTYLSGTKKNLTAKGYDLPVATSDLGDNWTASLATEVDIVMSNVHPFFGGIPIKQAAAWTWDFWQSHDVAVTAGMTGKQHIISEFGWPSAGGNDCGTAAGCPKGDTTTGAVAGIDNMNTLMDTWVCQALSNGTDYFWFEAFDEPWKIVYNNGTENWEDKWGMMDVNRNLKKGLVIPTCNGNSTAAA